MWLGAKIDVCLACWISSWLYLARRANFTKSSVHVPKAIANEPMRLQLHQQPSAGRQVRGTLDRVTRPLFPRLN